MKLEILDLAKGDLIDGYRFYEAQESSLGSYFIDTLYSDIDSLRIFGGIHRKAYKNLHGALSKRFPFAIYYTMELETNRVRSVSRSHAVVMASSGRLERSSVPRYLPLP